jgi:3-phenylpropionate/trans-cinnamate dioxygenase ferredoxin reductase subunit
MVGLSMDATQSVLRGKPDDGAFSVFHYKEDCLVAIDSVNRAADHMVGRRMLAGGMTLTPDEAADETVDLKSLIRK